MRPVYRSRAAVALFAFSAAAATTTLSAQAIARPTTQPQRVPEDKAASENRLAVATSGVWDMDGEYKTTTGAYHKLTGYFAYVASTSTSKDNGENAVIAMYLEPMSGGAATWISARLECTIPVDGTAVRCIAVQGAKQLLDLNFTFRSMPFRGMRADAEISEPDDKTSDKRFTSRSTPRGKFALVPIEQ